MRTTRLSIVPARAYDDSRLTDGAIVILGLLGTYADRDGWCWPSQKTLAERRKISRQMISRYLKELVDHGYLDRQPRARANGSNTTCMYRILYDTTTPPQFEVDVPEYEQMPEENEEPPAGMFPKMAPDLGAMVRVLYIVTKMSLTLNRPLITKTAKELMQDPTVTAEGISKVYGPGGAWYTDDFRGKMGQPPTLQQIKTTWGFLSTRASEAQVVLQDTEVNQNEGWYNG